MLTLPKNYLSPTPKAPTAMSNGTTPAPAASITERYPKTIGNLKILGPFPETPTTPTTPAPTTPTTPTTPAPSGMAPVNVGIDPMVKAQEDLAKQLGANTTPQNEQQIRQQMIVDNQAYIDAVNKRYDALNEMDTKAGLIREDQTRSFNIRSGNMGSDFASSAVEETRGANRKVIDANNAIRNQELAAIYSKINTGAREEAMNAKKLSLESAEKRIQILESQKMSSLSQITEAAKNGLPFDSLKNTKLDNGESVFDYIKRTTGKSDFEIEHLYNQNLPENQKRTYEYKTVGDKAYAFSINPTTKKPEWQDLGIEVPADSTFTIAPDGTPLVYNKSTGEATIATGFRQGQFAKPEAPKSAETFKPTSQEVSAVKRYLQTLPNYKPSDLAKAEADSGFFYAMLDAASKAEGFNLQPFKADNTIIIK